MAPTTRRRTAETRCCGLEGSYGRSGAQVQSRWTRLPPPADWGVGRCVVLTGDYDPWT
jgi:hypothetical protein